MELLLQVNFPYCRGGLCVRDEMDGCALFLSEVHLYRDTFASDHGANFLQDREDRVAILAAAYALFYPVNVLA